MADAKQKQLDAIARQIERCAECKVNKIGVAVPGEGGADAQVVFVGEAPGKEEAKSGRPFIGRSGKVLRSLIATLGLKDADIYITSPVKYLPLHKTPTPKEIEHGRTHLDAQLAVIEPKVIVMLGRVSGVALLKKSFVMSRDHGTFIEENGKTYLLTYHPSGVRYAQKMKDAIAADFKKLKQYLRDGKGN
jgi:DNA polymerase